MRSESFNVELQGVTADLMQANGSYDTVSFQNVSASRIAEILQIVSGLCPPDGDDVCPVNVSVHGPLGDKSFSVFDDSGQLYCADPEGAMSIEQAIIMVTGKKPDFAIPATNPAPQQTNPRSCPNCQTTVEPDESFCGNCGEAVTANSNATTQAKPAKPPKAKKAPIDQQTYNSIIGLMANPISLREYRNNHSYLQKGPKGQEFRQVIDAMFRTDPPPEVHTRLTMPPRCWAIKKPGKFRRALTAIVDFPLLLILMVVGIRAGESFGLDPDGLIPGIMALSWIFVIVPVGFYTLFETTLGASPGGLLIGLRVVDDYGNKASPSVSIIRIFSKLVWILTLILSILSLKFQMDRFPGHLVTLPSGETIQAIDDNEVVIN